MERSSEWSNRTAGIQKSVLEKWTKQAKPQDTLNLCQFLNDLAATIASHPKRSMGLGTLPLQAPELVIKEMEYCVKELGFPGVQISSHINLCDLNMQELFPVYAVKKHRLWGITPYQRLESKKLEQLGFSPDSVYSLAPLHPKLKLGESRQKPGVPAETIIAICSMIMGGVFKKFPKLQVCFAHGVPLVFLEMAKPGENILGKYNTNLMRDTISSEEYYRHLQTAFRTIHIHQRDKVILGMDYPFPLGELEPGKLIESIEEFDAETKDKLKAGNALAFLGLERKQFE
ncbi:2-amino-3-carboxymuconate-6-semialdehyde decarboxylase [Pteropus alecto]|uniref:2-amino-3-carboxymuconate-6-semialdehyde decarboxylase n=1 Tax=Pteropus alecto TaxID=9402 RepID=L5JZ23_PTEAL|nr:2-amino-3-carboxymuconate-6-semialdehyde decarboxylase [Pteropus alecto]